MATIYVDRLHKTVRTKRWPYQSGAHLFTTPGNLAALHAFAARMRLRHSWFQSESVMPHYDLVESMREQALAMGAVEADWETFKTIFGQWQRQNPHRSRRRKR